MEEAARIAYEAAEEDGWLTDAISMRSAPQIRLTSFKYMFLVQAKAGAIVLRGVRPPSSKSRPIPADQYDALYPADGRSEFNYIHSQGLAYEKVTIDRRALQYVIKTYKEIARGDRSVLREFDLERDVSPLQILFDPRNEDRRYWSPFANTSESGKPAGEAWEYRIEVRNNSPETVRNIRVTKEDEDLDTPFPVDLEFREDAMKNRELQPGCSESIPIFWKYPRRAGDAAPTGTAAFYGPMKIVISGDGVPPTRATFGYYADMLPAVVRYFGE